MSYVPGKGNHHSKIVFVGDVPGLSEEQAGVSLLAGESGKVLERIFDDIKISPNGFYFTNLHKYRVNNNDLKKFKVPTESLSKFWIEIQEINPNVIVTFGEIAFEELTGLKKLLLQRASVLPNTKYGYLPKIIPTIHPLNLGSASDRSGDRFPDKKPYSGIWRNIMGLDIQKAINHSRTPEYKSPERFLKVATSSLDVKRLLDRNRGKIPFIDVETYRSTLCTCIAIAFDRYESLSIPLFHKVGDIILCTIPTSDLAHIWWLLQKLFSEYPIAGQNLKFDQHKLEMLGFTFPKGIYSDVMLKAHTVNPELPSKGLAFLTSIYTDENYYKDEGSEFNPAKHDSSRLFLYNAKDSAVTCEIDEELELEIKELSELYKTDLSKFYHEYVVPQHQFYFDLEKVGFCIDEGKLAYLRVKYETWLDILQNRLNVAAQRNININSPKQVTQFVYGDMRIPVLDKYKIKVDDDAFSRLLKDKVKNEAKRGVLRDILEFRRVSKTLNTYLLCERDYDNKIRSQYRIIGTETGRSSTSILDEPIRPKSIGFAFQTLTKHGDIGQDIRSYLIPEKGKVFINVDLSQAEARVVALLSKDVKLLDAFDHIDIHRRTAGLALITGKMNLSYEFDPTCDTIGKDSPERFMGKKVRHAGNYDMGWKEFMSNVITDCRRFNIEFTISPFLAKQTLERFHAANPLLRDNFHKEIKDAIDYNRCLITPYGRVRRFFDRYTERLYKEAYASIPQDTVKQRLTRAALKMSKIYPDLRKSFCGEAHDSLTLQLPANEYLDICREFKMYMEEPIDFSNCTLKRGTLVIPCEFEIGENYKDLRKLEL